MIRLASLAALVLGLTACASFRTQTAPRDPSLLSEQPAPAGRVCRVVPEPAELPAAAVLVDSAALHTAILELQEGRPAPARGYVLLSMAYDRHGANIRRAVIEHDLPTAVADSLQQLVFAHRNTVPAGEEWGARLRIDLGEEVGMQVGRQEFCPPRPRGAGMMYETGNLWARTSPGMGTETVWVRVYVDPLGSVAGARVERGFVTGVGEHQLFNYMRTLAFEPALADGIPVSGSTVVPIAVRRR